jgi:hypothetical protein
MDCCSLENNHLCIAQADSLSLPPIYLMMLKEIIEKYKASRENRLTTTLTE